MNTTLSLGWSVSTLNRPPPRPEPPALPGHRLELITGELELRLPLALNAPEGVWTQRARDVASGLTAVE